MVQEMLEQSLGIGFATADWGQNVLSGCHRSCLHSITLPYYKTGIRWKIACPLFSIVASVSLSRFGSCNLAKPLLSHLKPLRVHVTVELHVSSWNHLSSAYIPLPMHGNRTSRKNVSSFISPS